MVRKSWNKWEARWHENKIPMRKSFDNEQEAIKFENEKRALNKLQQKREREKQRQSKTKEQRREEGLLKSIADNYKDCTTHDQDESSYSSRHASTPEHEKGAQEIVSKHEREVRKASSDLVKDFNNKIEVIENNDTKSSLYSSRHISTQNEEKGAEAIVIKNEEKIREEMKKEKS